MFGLLQSVADSFFVIEKGIFNTLFLWQPDNVVKAAVAACPCMPLPMDLSIPYPEWLALQPPKKLFLLGLIPSI
jgi:hypothetical protein